eukprot:TRINITY_DN75003_c0_g1_i1.p1 TRINITY_DN75003_c0_g1~~TRINITY_DN75003_c0_g1_i1.p1  ORF type:complete len:198 (+),score=46.44 TRINITY_DN75003_c0_g1_i1:83-676(+)
MTIAEIKMFVAALFIMQFGCSDAGRMTDTSSKPPEFEGGGGGNPIMTEDSCTSCPSTRWGRRPETSQEKSASRSRQAEVQVDEREITKASVVDIPWDDEEDWVVRDADVPPGDDIDFSNGAHADILRYTSWILRCLVVASAGVGLVLVAFLGTRGKSKDSSQSAGAFCRNLSALFLIPLVAVAVDYCFLDAGVGVAR